MIISKNTKIFLILFSIVLVILTIVAILYTNKNKGVDESQVIIEEANQMSITSFDTTSGMNDTVKGISFDDTYSVNGLTYTYKDDEKNGVKITYPIIEGLNNSDVQKSINEQIVQKINKVLDSNNFKNNSDRSAYANATVVGNFSDVLSVKVFVKFNENFSKDYGVNFRLDNGERIKPVELFTYNAPTKNIITENAYTSFALGYYTAEGLSNEFYTNIDSDILNFLLDYNNGKVAEFSFTPTHIELYRDGKSVKIDMQRYADYIAIYTRFKASQNLYDDTDKVIKGLPVFTKRREDVLLDLYEKVNDSCILDIYILKDGNIRNEFSDREKTVINNYKHDFISKLQAVKKEKGIYYSNFVTVSRGREDDEEVLVFTEHEAFMKTLEKDFKEYYNRIVAAERDINNEDYSKSRIFVLDKNDISEGVFEIKYSVETGREYVPEEPEDDEPENPSPSESPETPSETTSPRPTGTTTPSPTVNTGNNTSVPDSSESPEPIQSPSPTPTGNITTQVYF